MRITNTMSTNRLMLDTNRNRTLLDKYYTQMSTGKQIQYASENPIIASRTLRFRTAVAETEQYARNVEQGYSWMEISESAIANSEDILQRMRSLLIQGSTGSLTDEDRNNVIQEIKGLAAEVGNQMNQTYAGRYVFSGYRTDTAAVFDTDVPNTQCYDYKITQKFDYTNVEDYKAYFKPEPDEAAEVIEAKRIKLPYTNIKDNSITINMGGTTDVNGNITGATTVTPLFMNSNDPGIYTRNAAGQMELSADAIYLKDTGELLIATEPSNVGGLVPAMDDAMVTAGKFTPDLTLGGKAGTGGISITYNKDTFVAGDLNPEVYFDLEVSDPTTTPPTVKKYDMDNQNMQYEFSVGVRVDVNNLAKDMFTAEMSADFDEFYSFVNSMSISDEADVRLKFEGEGLSGTELDAAVEAQLSEENSKARSVSQSRFEQMIDKIDKHMTQLSKERTDMGSRMARLEMMGNRLSDDTLSYTALLTKTEEADLFETVTNLNNMDAMYQASLKTGMMMIRTTLADFI